MHRMLGPDQHGAGAAAVGEAASQALVTVQNAGTEINGASFEVG